MLLPIPHKKTPWFRRRSISLRRKIEWACSPASTPNLVQQKAAGIDVLAWSLQLSLMRATLAIALSRSQLPPGVSTKST